MCRQRYCLFPIRLHINIFIKAFHGQLRLRVYRQTFVITVNGHIGYCQLQNSLQQFRELWLLFQVDVEQHTLAKYLMELSMLDYDMVHFPPSQIAAGAFCLALKILDNGEWVSSVPQTLVTLSFYIVSDVCMNTRLFSFKDDSNGF